MSMMLFVAVGGAFAMEGHHGPRRTIVWALSGPPITAGFRTTGWRPGRTAMLIAVAVAVAIASARRRRTIPALAVTVARRAANGRAGAIAITLVTLTMFADSLADFFGNERRRATGAFRSGAQTRVRLSGRWRSAKARAARSSLRPLGGHRHDGFADLHRQLHFVAGSPNRQGDVIAFLATADEHLQLLRVDEQLVIQHREHVILLEARRLGRTVGHHIADEHTKARLQAGLGADLGRNGADDHSDVGCRFSFGPAHLLALSGCAAWRRTATMLPRAFAFGFSFGLAARLGRSGGSAGFASRIGFLRLRARRPKSKDARSCNQSCEVGFHDWMDV